MEVFQRMVGLAAGELGGGLGGGVRVLDCLRARLVAAATGREGSYAGVLYGVQVGEGVAEQI